MRMKKTLFGASLFLWILLLTACHEVCLHTEMTHSITSPTCDKEGYTLHNCSLCDYFFKTDLTPPTGHILSKTLSPPTCTDEGYTTFTCDCGYTYQGEFSEPTGHDYQETVILPTCKTEGYKLNRCSTCDHSYQSEICSVLEHAFVSRVTNPTCFRQGYTEHSCQTCDLTYRSDPTPPSGHNLSTTYCLHPTLYRSGRMTTACDQCSYSFTNYLFFSDVYPGAKVENKTVLAKGVDVSIYQHKKNENGDYLPLNWSALRSAGVEFAILKAGSTPRIGASGASLGGMDAVFEMNYADAKAMGIELGAYFYTYATTLEQVQKDAELLVTWLEGKQFEYPIYFDLEDPSLESKDRQTLTEFCLTFVNVLRKNGYYGALYTNNDWLVNRLDTEIITSSLDLWYARYPQDRMAMNSPVTITETYAWSEKYGTQLGMWQYTNYGVIDGIDGIYFDFNYSYKNYGEWMKRFCFNGFYAAS